jgi:hypothetical protein
VWEPEKNGTFSVRSAYRLGLQPVLERLSQGQSSTIPEGDRKIWKCVWQARVPPKLRVFAWKASTSTLAVMSNVHRRIRTVSPICKICGREEEDEHHALVKCTLARGLREELRKV